MEGWREEMGTVQGGGATSQPEDRDRPKNARKADARIVSFR